MNLKLIATVISVFGSEIFSQEVVCLEGFIMDQYCIDRGTLLDNPSLNTLQNPASHTIHCLVDISSCCNSGYELLTTPREGSNKFCRSYQLDDTGNKQTVALARSVGSCSTCDGSGMKESGFRAVVTGTVTVATGSSDLPTLRVLQILDESKSCSMLPDVVEITEPPCITTSGRLQPIMHLHGALMILSWGCLLPAGVITARQYKHRPNAFWFKYHRAMQITGLAIALTGVVIAIFNFTALSSPSTNAFVHGIFGIITMSLGLLQPINAFFRPHLPKEGEKKSFSRKVWSIIHKGSGYIALILAVITIVLGTRLLPEPANQTVFQVVYVAMIVPLICLVLYSRKDKKKIMFSEPDNHKVSEKVDEKVYQEEESEIHVSEEGELETYVPREYPLLNQNDQLLQAKYK